MFFLLVLALLWLIYKWSVKNFDYFEKIGVRFEKPKPLVGNILEVVLQRQSMIDLTRKGYKTFKNSKIFGFFNFKQECFYLTDPELIKQISIKDFDHFMNHNEAFTKADRIFDKTLLALKDKTWRNMRSTLSPIFTSSKMKMMFGLLSVHAQDFTNFFEERSKKGEDLIVDTREVFHRFTADGISTAALGFEADSIRNEDSYIYNIVRKIQHDFSGSIGKLKFTLAFVLPKFYTLLGLQCMSKELYDFFKRAVIDVMAERDRENITRPDVIQLLLQAKKGQVHNVEKENDVNDKDLANFSANIEYDVGSNFESASKFSDDDWIAQGFIFFGAGLSTTTNLLQLTTYELAKETHIQRELQDEIDAVILASNGNPISYEALHKMKFLDMVVSEGLRKWPPAPQIDRTCTKDYDMNLGHGKIVNIKKGQILFLPAYHIHHDPEYFPNPEKFDPYRFSDENKDKIAPGTFLPFGLGPRACIGSRFALMETKLLLFNLLSKFSVETCEKTPKSITFEARLFFRVKESVFVRFKLRK